LGLVTGPDKLRGTRFARDVAHQVCFLEEGRIIEQGPPQELFTDPRDEHTRRFLRRIVEAGRL
jgi:polar amino acid transport system ATP-binding protein